MPLYIVSHIGPRLKIQLGEPIADDSVMRKWCMQKYGRCWNEKEVEMVVKSLNGSFGDYVALEGLQKDGNLSVTGDAFLFFCFSCILIDLISNNGIGMYGGFVLFRRIGPTQAEDV